jgi:sterol desaturase/sphingolipid hydroxylase (fatty acid hydroxylase superfamily)
MHRIHHSVKAPLTNSNFGFSFPWWDRLFATYIVQPLVSHSEMKLGIDDFRDPKQVNYLPYMLLLPLTKHSGHYAINRRW